MDVTAESLAAMFGEIFPHLDERQRRLLMGAQARALGHGGIRLVAGAAGVREATVSLGAGELEAGAEPLGRARRPGGGARRARDKDPGLVPALLALVEPQERGDPESPLRWTVKSTRKLAAELTRQGHRIGADTVADLLREEGFSLQANVKTTEGKQHPDRDAQFRYIAAQASEHIAAGQPVISVDSKKRENVGPFARAGRDWRPRGEPVRVRDHDFPDERLGSVIPYGIYDLAANTGWVNVGTDHNTAAFAAGSIRRWWNEAGKDDYPGARRLLITADAGGSNGYRTRTWKAALAALAEETGLEITCCHFPPGTSKWNKIEHRLFAHITMNWRGRPLTSHAVVLNSIAATTTAAGLKVTAALDQGRYPTGIKVTGEQMEDLRQRYLTPHGFHGAWNYTMHPPAAPPPARPRPRPRTPPARARDALTSALNRPALTGLPRRELAGLVTALTPSWHAQQEALRYTWRGGPRRNAPGAHGHPRLGLAGQILVTLIHQHLSLPRHVIAWLTGTHPDTISQAINTISPLLARHKIRTTPAPAPLRTPADLISYATANGVRLPPKIKTTG
jgi:Rhodopirellula transposase DDE domain